MKNECAVVCFATSNKKRPNAMHISRIYDNKLLDTIELLLISEDKDSKFQIGVEMKPLMVFAGSQWEDTSSSETAKVFRQLKGVFLDLFQGEEIASVDVAGLQYVLSVSATEGEVEEMENRPVVCLRWYRVKTGRSDTPRVPRVELERVGPEFDFRVGRWKGADEGVWREAMKHGRRPGEARVKKNIETDLVGDKLGRIHLGRQDLGELQTRKMKGLKRGRDEDEEEVNGDGVEEDDEVVSQSEDEEEEDGGMVLGDESSEGGEGDEIDIGESDEEADQMPKRQRVQ